MYCMIRLVVFYRDNGNVVYLEQDMRFYDSIICRTRSTRKNITMLNAGPR